MNVRLVLASGAALGAIALSSPALAQDAPASEPAAEEEGGIIVTARRQSESLQDVPAAVTVFGAETLAKTGVQRADDFIQLTPGVTIVTGTLDYGQGHWSAFAQVLTTKLGIPFRKITMSGRRAVWPTTSNTFIAVSAGNRRMQGPPSAGI